MTTEELLEKTGLALASDEALTSWCVARFGKPASVFIGIDEAEPPEEEDYPLVAVVSIDQDRGIGEKEQTWMLFMGVGIVNGDIALSRSLRIRTGFLQAETLRELAENAVYRARILPARSAGRASSESYHPLYVSFTAISFKMLQAQPPYKG